MLVDIPAEGGRAFWSCGTSPELGACRATTCVPWTGVRSSAKNHDTKALRTLRMHGMFPELGACRLLVCFPYSWGSFLCKDWYTTFAKLRVIRPWLLTPLSPHLCLTKPRRHKILRPGDLSDYSTLNQHRFSSCIPSTGPTPSALIDFQSCRVQLGRLRTELRDVTRSLKIVKEQLQVEETRATSREMCVWDVLKGRNNTPYREDRAARTQRAGVLL